MSSPAGLPRRPPPTDSIGCGCTPRGAALVLTAVGVLLYLLATSVWGWLFPPGPLLEPLAAQDLPEWATGSVPPGDATVSFDAPAGWDRQASEAVGSGEDPALNQRWGYDPSKSWHTVSVTVTFRDGLADDEGWPGNGSSMERVDFHDLSAYSYTDRFSTTLLMRTGSWEIEISSSDDVDRSFLEAVAERVRFDPGTGGEDDPDFRAMTADSDLHEVCEGRSFPDGAAYDGPAPHPTQVLNRFGRADDELSYYSEAYAEWWPGTWPAEWAPGTADAREIQLVACVEPTDGVRTDATCPYTLGDLHAVLRADLVIVREVRTGRIVAESTATADFRCPATVEIELGEDAFTLYPTLGQYLAAVEPHTFG